MAATFTIWHIALYSVYICIIFNIEEHSIFTISKNLVLHKQLIYLQNIYMHTI